MKETIIAKTADYTVYKMNKAYYISYADRAPLSHDWYYPTIKAIKEALYYAGYLPEKTSKLP